jgi:hypothetical protein
MRLFLFLSLTALFAACQLSGTEHVANTLRAPAFPLITIDPYTSGWSFTDKLYDESVKHWTGKDFPLFGVIKVDGEAFRFMGKETPALEPVAPNSEQQPWTGKYTTAKPSADWMNAGFNDAKWKNGKGAFGTISRDKEPTAKTDWLDKEIWVRRFVNIDPNYA